MEPVLPATQPTPGPSRALFPWILVLLFGSGSCALIYQMTWLRDLRLVFGASTQATAAVLAIFMGGLGAGSAWFGRRADRHLRPLRLYGWLELGIAATAALAPGLLVLVRGAYIAAGGTQALGPLAGTLVQLVLAAVVIGVPAVLMGGTLPAAARAVGSAADQGRRRIALLYGVNALGAAGGVLLATFLLLESLGARATLWAAAGLNLVLALAALVLSRTGGSPEPDLAIARTEREEPQHAIGQEAEPRGAILAAAALTGSVFFLLEIVWYRMLAPILGGSTYTFGLILAVALLGIALGSTLYGWLPRRSPPTLALFAVASGLEALAVAVPFALGDRLAVLALLLRPLGVVGFAGMVSGWAVVTACVVMPAALVAGYQFPILIGLLGRGGRRAGSDTGAAYAWNTGGAIAGSLAGGFVLLPVLTAPGLWRLCAALLAALALLALALGLRRERRSWVRVAAPAAALAAVLLVALPRGPTAAWRHSPIGAGRIAWEQLSGPDDLANFMHSYRRSLSWEADGRESAIGLLERSGVSLIIGGKSDGNAINDAGTQVMLGMLGALLHPEPRRALVVGLGTGSTSGWLGQVPSIERVDTIELEPAVATMARRCAVTNRDVMSNPKVRILNGDAREFLLTGRQVYDVIASEPSNPYRAGVASLFTREFYEAAARRLAPGGLFLQWVQGYEVDLPTLQTVYATLGAEFSHVETWSTQIGDLVLVCSQGPQVRDAATLRQRVREEPFRSALQSAWRVTDLEGVIAHYVANDGFRRWFAGSARPNTDDRTVLEYRFARSLGGSQRVDVTEMWAQAIANHQSAPDWHGLSVDVEKVIRARAAMFVLENKNPPLPPEDSRYFTPVSAMRAFLDGNFSAAYANLERTDGGPSGLTELAMSGEILATAGLPAALKVIEELRPFRPVEADFMLARLRLSQGDLSRATDAYASACQAFRRDPWTWSAIAERALPMAAEIAKRDRSGLLASRLLSALEVRFAASSQEEERLWTRLQVATEMERDAPGERTRTALQPFEKGVPWQEAFLETRAACYANLGDPRAARAQRDLETFRAHRTPELSDLVAAGQGN